MRAGECSAKESAECGVMSAELKTKIRNGEQGAIRQGIGVRDMTNAEFGMRIAE